MSRHPLRLHAQVSHSNEWRPGRPSRLMGYAFRDCGRARWQGWPAGAAQLALAVLLCARGAWGGATIDVGPELADGAWRAVVANATANSTIRFSAGTYRAGASGCSVSLPVNASLVAATPGKGAVIIDCQGSDRHFVVAAGARAVMEGLVLANGASGADAGCVLVEAGASLEFRDGVLSNCRASGSGGGIHVAEGGYLVVSDSTFEECVADAEGGGVCAFRSSLLLERSGMRSCGADLGGAVYGDNSKIVVAGGTYEANTAGASGGMAYVVQSHLTVTAGTCIFGGEAARGGAVYAKDHSVVHMRGGVTMRDNHARYHGGALYGHTSSEIMLSENTQVKNNSADGDSGAAHLWSQSSLHAFDNVTFEDNTAADDAGAISSQGASEDGPTGVIRLERGVVFARNSANDAGGAIFVLGRVTLLVYGDVEFVGNTAGDDGGAIEMTDSSGGAGILDIQGSVVFRDNVAGSYGGALYLRFTVWCGVSHGVVFEQNNAEFGGGAVYVRGSVLHISDAHFDRNMAFGLGLVFGDSSTILGKGGSMYVTAGSAVEIMRSMFFENAAFIGGAIFARASALNVTDRVVFTRCKASLHAGVLWLEAGSSAHIHRDVDVSENQVLYSDAGAIMLDGDPPSHLYIGHHVRFERNSANSQNGKGGAIVVQAKSTLQVSDTVVFVDNSANRGGAVAGVGSGLTLTFESGVTFSRNAALNKGGAIYIFGVASEDDTPVCEATTATDAVLPTFLLRLRHGVLLHANSGLDGGGGIYMHGLPKCSAHLETEGNVQIVENRGHTSGGGIFALYSIVTLGAGTWIRNNSAFRGGGTKLQFARLVSPKGDTHWQSNSAQIGGGLHVSMGCHVHLVGADISSNVAHFDDVDSEFVWDGSGGGVFALGDAVLVFSGVRMHSNVAALGGGAASMIETVSFAAQDCEFKGNSALAGQGGALLSTSTGLASFAQCSFIRNSARAGIGCVVTSCGSGGAVAVTGNAQVLVLDSHMAENSAEVGPSSAVSLLRGGGSGRGGGLVAHHTASVTLQNVVLLQNRAASDGGGIYASDDSSITLRGLVTLTANRAKHLGGGMFLGPTSSNSEALSCAVDNLEARGNVAEEGSGGAIFSSRHMTCSAGGRTVLHENRAALEGGALALDETSMLLLQGHTLEAAHNDAGSNGGAVALLSGASIAVEELACDSDCVEAKRGDGNCDPSCLSSACNWDDGDCVVHQFATAGVDAQHQCVRVDSAGLSSFSAQCSESMQTSRCDSRCFDASCDFSRHGCVEVMSRVASCPILDAVVLNAMAEAHQPVSSLTGGTSQEYGWCHGECQSPEAPPRAAILTGSGRGGGSALVLDGHGAWLALEGLGSEFLSHSSFSSSSSSPPHLPSADFSVEVWAKVGGMPPFTPAEQWVGASNMRMAFPVGFVLAGSNFAIAMLLPLSTDADSDVAPRNASNVSAVSAWPLVFAGPPPASACYGQDVVLQASTGRIGDGPDMISRDGSSCAWTIAPPGARSVTLLFTEFYLLKTALSYKDYVQVCMCLDTACLELEGCMRFSGGELPPTLTSTTGIMHVLLHTTGLSFRTNPGFTAFYAAAYDAERLEQGSWHHVAVTVESAAQHAATAGARGTNTSHAQPAMCTLRVYMDGSEAREHTSLLWDPQRNPAFGGAFGTAVGRASPHWQHNPHPVYTAEERDAIYDESARNHLEYIQGGPHNFLDAQGRMAVPWFNLGRFNGSLDDLRVWQVARAASDINASLRCTCAELQTPRLAACYNFEHHGETHFTDASPHGRAQARTASGESPHLPWCKNANDAGSLAHTIIQDEIRHIFSPVSWGFCAQKLRLPGSGFDYNHTDMRQLAQLLAAAEPSHVASPLLIERFPGCGVLAFNMSHNTAGAYGGAVFVDSCRGHQRCFLDGVGPLSGTRASLFADNRAEKGGGALFMACNAFNSACLNAFAASNAAGFFPSLPKHEFTRNVAGYGDDLASDPALLLFLHGTQELMVVPGQQQLVFELEFLDSLNTRCKHVDAVVQIVVCRETDTCTKHAAVSAVTFHDAAWETGLFSISQVFHCPMQPGAVQENAQLAGGSAGSAMYATVQASLLSFSAVQSREVPVRVYTTF